MKYPRGVSPEARSDQDTANIYTKSYDMSFREISKEDGATNKAE